MICHKYRVLTNLFDNALNTVKDSKNPEIHHYHRGSHPGITWHIKTVIPGERLLNSNTAALHALWKHLETRYPRMVRISNQAYHWNGDIIPGWITIWVDTRIDIIVTWTSEDGFKWEMIDFDQALKKSADTIIYNIAQNRHSGDDQVNYQELVEIVDFLKTFTSDKASQENKSKIRVLDDNDEIHTETDNRP